MKYIFIDRDGVINKDPGGWTEHSYVTNWKDFRFLPGAFEALKLLNRSGVRVIVVSNQAGVSKGYFSKEKLDSVNAKMLDEINRSGGRIESVYYCVHKEEDNCLCRKPKTGLFEMAAKKYGIDPRTTYIIGDSEVDILAGKKIGSKTIFVLSGKTTSDQMNKWVEKPDYVFPSLIEAVKWLLAKEHRKTQRAAKRATRRNKK